MMKARNDMDIENNASAYQMMNKLMTEVENKIRSAYNYGFQDGTEQGRAEVIEIYFGYEDDDE